MSGRIEPSAVERVVLFREIAVFDHAGKLGDPAQRQFAPLASDFRLA